jgi:hypothetical protein
LHLKAALQSRVFHTCVYARKSLNLFKCYLWNNWMNKRKAYSFVNDLMCICTGNSY